MSLLGMVVPRSPGENSMLNRILLAAEVSWIYSVTLGLLYAACASGHFSLRTLRLPGVVLVAVIFSTVVSLCITPIAVWSLRTGLKNLYIYGPILWIILATVELGIIPITRVLKPHDVALIAVIGLIGLGFVPARKASGPDRCPDSTDSQSIGQTASSNLSSHKHAEGVSISDGPRV
jgi:hypothetical protein